MGKVPYLSDHSDPRNSDETSCNTLTFGMYEIARNSEIQERLHAEISDVLGQFQEDKALEYPALEKMLYLQAVVKETLRLHAVVAHGMFKAGKDNIIPLSKPITTTHGDTVQSVPVMKGQRVVRGCIYRTCHFMNELLCSFCRSMV
jgi:hypothetical protein